MNSVECPKVVVTMTSWTQRISTVSTVIAQFLRDQTIKPDIFYLWLSEEEFPNHEADLPADLVKLSSFIQIKWLPGNEGVFKRWSVYPEHFNDYVLCIDDDSLHSPMLVEDCLARMKQFDNHVICNAWQQFSAVPFYFDDIKINWRYIQQQASQTIWACGTKMVPPKAFPLEAFDAEVTEWRKVHFPANDEVWLIPYFLRNEMPITYPQHPMRYITIGNEKQTSLAQNINMKAEQNGYRPTEIQLHDFLEHLGLLDLYKSRFPGYNDQKYLAAIQK